MQLATLLPFCRRYFILRSPAKILLVRSPANTFPRRSMPADSLGVAGAERVNRFATAKRFAAGPNTEFIDFFNSDLIPGIEMSGGYGLFLSDRALARAFS